MFACNNLNVSYVRISAPDDSPNTDGIKIGSSHRVRISRSVIQTGDDCVAILSGTTKIHISKVRCGPGHGISIGSLGRHEGERDVNGIIVKNSTFSGTSNGVRIKTWASNAVMKASNFVFQDLVMKDVLNPIIIDQQYCPYGSCNKQVRNSKTLFFFFLLNIISFYWNWRWGLLIFFCLDFFQCANQQRFVQEHSGNFEFRGCSESGLQSNMAVQQRGAWQHQFGASRLSSCQIILQPCQWRLLWPPEPTPLRLMILCFL